MGLGKKLKKISKSLTPKSILNSVLGFGSDPGIPNAYGAPDPMQILAGYRKPSAGYAKPTGISETLFNDYIKSIGSSSGVDEMERRIESDVLLRTLDEIDSDTRNAAGSLKLDFQDRGLGGPAQISEMESQGLAEAYGLGADRKADARASISLGQLEREKAKDDALRTAYGGRYSAGVASDAADKGIAAQMALADAQGYNELLARAYGLQSDLYKSGQNLNAATQKGGFLEDILRNVQVSVGMGK